MNKKSKVKLTGSRSLGWFITVSDDDFYENIAITHEEAVLLHDLLNKKIK